MGFQEKGEESDLDSSIQAKSENTPDISQTFWLFQGQFLMSEFLI